MKSNPLNPRIRLHISLQTLAELKRIRQATGNKSWDEFFCEIIAREENMPPKSASKTEAVDMKTALAKLDKLQDQVNKISGQLEAHDESEQGLVSEIGNFHKTLEGIHGLLAFALEAVTEENRTPHKAGEKAERLRKFVEGR